MNFFGKVISNFKVFYNEINGATLTGAIDVVVVQQEDGEYQSSPFHVRFGKIGVLRSREKVVDIEINGNPVDIHMKLGETGEAFFVEKLDDDEDVSEHLGTSPLPRATFYSPNERADASRKLDFHEDQTDGNPTEVPTDGVNPTGCSLRAPSPRIAVPRSDGRGGHSRSKSFSAVVPLDPGQVVVEGNGSRTDNEEIIKITRGRRKKRRKVSHAKRLSQEAKHKLNDGHSSENSTTSETPESAFQSGLVFKLDDIEAQDDETLSTIHSTSMPQLSQMRKTSRWELPFNFAHNMHPFSDTDISPPGSRHNSRPETPIKSDTEYELQKYKTDLEIEEAVKNAGTKWQWTWGELPTPPSKLPTPPCTHGATANENLPATSSEVALHASEQADAQQRSIANMFGLMRYTKKTRHNPDNDGIYLDEIDLDGMDPELVSIYFPKSSFADTQFKPVSKDEDMESGNGTSLPQSPHSIEGAIGGPKATCDSDFEDSPRHPIFDFKGYHDVAFSLCGQLHDYIEEEFPTSLFMQSLITYDDFVGNPQIMVSPDLVVRLNNRYMNWATAAPELMSLVLFQRPLPEHLTEKLAQDNMPQKMRKRTESKGYSWFSWARGNAGDQKIDQHSSKPNSANEDLFTASQSLPNVSSLDQPSILDARSSPDLQIMTDDKKESSGSEDEKLGSKYKKSLRLTSEQIKKLNLRHGLNQVVFSVTTAYQGTSRCKCNLFLWNHDEKIVISDIDGTITKSDVLGHILPILGQDWAQSGVAELYTKIKNNGYSFLYLSARAIGQAHLTRDYLQSIKQGNRTLPDGPLLLNPTSLIQAFHREVIIKKPEEFKISCLKDIQTLFNGRNPFYAGFGNRLNDVWAYREVDVPITRIFTINHQGVIKHEHSRTFQTTYPCLSDIAHLLFPSSYEEEGDVEYSTSQYWKTPLPDISEEIAGVLQIK